MLIDTHSHIFLEYYDNIDEIINNMNGYIIVAGCDDKTNLEVIDLVNKYDKVFGMLGIQPEEIDKITPNSFKIIEENLANPKIVGIGEIGIDYHWVSDNHDKQIEVFKKQLDLARKYNMPVVIHSRDAAEDTYNILSEYKDLKKVLHCYSYSLDMAYRFQKIGCLFGIGGVITFKNNRKLSEVVEALDLENFVLETDSPFLSPEPFRGQKNEPANTYYVAKKISEIKNIDIEKTLEIIGKTTISQFDLNVKM